MKRIILSSVIILITVFTGYGSYDSSLVTNPITQNSLNSLPVPSDSKNYFILQSLENCTNIIIGDFSGAEKVICLISDKNSDGTVDEILEYYPDSKTITPVAKPTTQLFTNYVQLKKDIIEGVVFKDPMRANSTEYTHEMASLPQLKRKISEGRYITKRGNNGRYVRVIDPDKKNTTIADYFFGKELEGYALQFRTLYYKSGSMSIEPSIQYSVYCRNSKDTVVAEYVEMLLKLAKERKV